MVAQVAKMERLAAATHRPNLRVSALAFGSWEPHLTLPLHDWEDDQHLVIVGTITATAVLDEPHDIATYTHVRPPRRTRRVRGVRPARS
jgi:hypothetical protein